MTEPSAETTQAQTWVWVQGSGVRGYGPPQQQQLGSGVEQPQPWKPRGSGAGYLAASPTPSQTDNTAALLDAKGRLEALYFPAKHLCP